MLSRDEQKSLLGHTFAPTSSPHTGQI